MVIQSSTPVDRSFSLPDERSLAATESRDLVLLRNRLDRVLQDRLGPTGLFGPSELVVRDEMAMRRPQSVSTQADLAQVLSPTKVRAFLDCSARYWFRYGLRLPEPKTSSLALGIAVHGALEVNFREKLETGEDLAAAGVVAVFRDTWLDQVEQTAFRDEEVPEEIRAKGEELVLKYLDEAAPSIVPAAVELSVHGTIAGVPVCGRVDLIDVEGRIVDVKTAARRPSSVPASYAFQIATYRQITPGASGEARLDSLVKTKSVQLVRQDYTICEEDLKATRALYPLVQEGIRNGLYIPNRQSFLCNRRNCAFWRQCQDEFGGTVDD